MSLLFSRQCEYALQAVSYLAIQPEGKLTSIKELTGQLHIPYHFLGKILQQLAQKGILISRKGHDGGFALAESPEKMTLLIIIEAIDGTNFRHQCIMGFPECSGEHPCAVHARWETARNDIFDSFSKKNLAEMAREMNKPEYNNAL
jgi:Rrf2 family iron-sulfur cluster assembly transcriptional regulator